MTRKRSRRRRGLTLVPALVCLVVATSLCAAILRKAHTQRELVKSLERQAQAEWLAESGLARATARLGADRAYQGETWKLPAEAFGGTDEGVVRVAVTAVKGHPSRRSVRVEADYPASDEHRNRQSRTQTVELGPDPPKGPS